MKLFGFDIRRTSQAETRNVEDPRVPISALSFAEFFGVSRGNLTNVTIETAMRVPAVTCAVSFLSRSLASLPMHVYRRTPDGPDRMTGKIETVIHEAPNPDMGAFKFRQYFWQQVFTGGRGLAWIERAGQNVEALWLIDPTKASIQRRGGKVFYEFEGREYPASDVIDVPFMLHTDMLNHYGPITLAEKAIQLALAMNDYASGFFAGGGVPPLALVGPLPQGPDAMRRALADIQKAIDTARKSDKPVFPMPPGHELKPIGFDPEKGQMTDARRFQVEEIARAYQLPPMFLQDLTRANFANSEQQDLHLVKHLIGQWAQSLEDEMNLKLFGRLNNTRYVEHNLDGLLRGDLLARMTAIGNAVQNALLTPNEGRALDNRPAMDGGDSLMIQGATVPLMQAGQGVGNGQGNPDAQADA